VEKHVHQAESSRNVVQKPPTLEMMESVVMEEKAKGLGVSVLSTSGL